LLTRVSYCGIKVMARSIKQSIKRSIKQFIKQSIKRLSAP
jgi:hypothetical protein